jgi:hypothetical protein
MCRHFWFWQLSFVSPPGRYLGGSTTALTPTSFAGAQMWRCNPGFPIGIRLSFTWAVSVVSCARFAWGTVSGYKSAWIFSCTISDGTSGQHRYVYCFAGVCKGSIVVIVYKNLDHPGCRACITAAEFYPERQNLICLCTDDFSGVFGISCTACRINRIYIGNFYFVNPRTWIAGRTGSTIGAALCRLWGNMAGCRRATYPYGKRCGIIIPGMALGICRFSGCLGHHRHVLRDSGNQAVEHPG